MKAIEEDKVVLITNTDFDKVLKVFPPSVTEADLKLFDKFNADINSLLKRRAKATKKAEDKK